MIPLFFLFFLALTNVSYHLPYRMLKEKNSWMKEDIGNEAFILPLQTYAQVSSSPPMAGRK